jgi:hypothetical protein
MRSHLFGFMLALAPAAVLAQEEADSLIYAEGKIINAETGEPISARIVYESLPYGNRIGVINNSTFSFAMFDKDRYSITVEAPGFAPANGSICASSCPLLFAGGTARLAGDKAAIGLHQFYAVSGSASEPAQAMSDAQITTARISRHLAEMGIDPALWLHALDTPPRQLYYLSTEEMESYGLVSGPELARGS